MVDRDYDNLGKRDLVSILLQVATNPTIRRGAMIEGHQMLGTGDQYPPGSADAQANRSTARWIPDYHAEWELGQSYRVQPEHLLARYLDQNYQVHPDAPAELKSRVFFYEKQGASEIGNLVLDAGQSLLMSFLNVSNDKSAEFKANTSFYEAILEAEKELGNNPLVLREAVEKCLANQTNDKGKEIASFCYIWAVPRK